MTEKSIKQQEQLRGYVGDVTEQEDAMDKIVAFLAGDDEPWSLEQAKKFLKELE